MNGNALGRLFATTRFATSWSQRDEVHGDVESMWVEGLPFVALSDGDACDGLTELAHRVEGAFETEAGQGT